jgi:hypothetical protein
VPLECRSLATAAFEDGIVLQLEKPDARGADGPAPEPFETDSRPIRIASPLADSGW